MTPITNPDLVRAAALTAGVCVRPVISRVTDITTGEMQLVPIACGSTREDRCPPCADRARRLRMHQCREGWHLGSEPERPEPDQSEDCDDGAEAGARRVRSTRRRQDAPDLPRVPMAERTIASAFEAPDGRKYRPSMFLALTLRSYGRVIPDGVPRDPRSYDYRRAALDALHFPKLVDRFWQNLRRSAGYRVQYFAVVDAQRRLTSHLHAAARGVVPRRVFHQVRAATYHQLWCPAHDTPVYTDSLGRVFVGPKAATPKRSNFNRYWQDAVKAAGVEVDPDVGLHLHDLRHTGNDLRAAGGNLRDLMDHMGHSTQHAALVYQHANVERQKAMAERITEAVREEIWPTSGPGDDVAPVRQLGDTKSHPA